MPARDSLSNTPAADELEVSLFGPGIGECVVVHLGHNEWLVADSCCARGSKSPAALDYFDRIGVDVSTAVRLIVVTHWHDDHINGIARLLEAAKSARLFSSAALNGKEFLKFVSYHRTSGTLSASSGVDEMYQVLSLLTARRKMSGASTRAVGPEWVKANECLWQRQNPAASVHALSPSSGALTLALQEFGSALDTVMPRRRAVAQTANEVAVALWVDVGGLKVLLGSDLEESPDDNCGWKAIIASSAKPVGKARVFKVAHHGSETAHNEAVWSSMLDRSPHAVLTTFSSGKPLPSDGDVRRILGRASTLHSTSPPKGWSPPRRDAAVERTVREVVTRRRVVRGSMGHVRLRCKIGAPDARFSIELFGSALDLAGP